VLVGHSYGGAVITNAAAGVPNVKALVYIATFVPDVGETLGARISKSRAPRFPMTASVQRLVLHRCDDSRRVAHHSVLGPGRD
jgi:pimeloyl-ACP methyl ester carboxylesterase